MLIGYGEGYGGPVLGESSEAARVCGDYSRETGFSSCEALTRLLALLTCLAI